MPIRIYALGKELKIDSKELVELCRKAGISGKGSALASLDEEEVAKLKAYLSGSSKKSSAPAKKTSASAKDKKDASKAPITRDDYIASASSSKIKVIGAASKKETPESEEGAEEPPKPKRKREPVIRLAKSPDVKAVVAPKSNEPKAQKPEIRLPLDAIRGAKKGVRSPLESHLSSTEKKQKPAARKPAAPAQTPEDSSKGKGRGRKGKSVEGAGEGKEGKGLAGMASARASRSKTRKSRSRVSLSQDDDRRRTYGGRRPRRLTRTRKGTNTAAPRKSKVTLALPCTVRSFSEAAGIQAAQVQKALMGLGAMVTINAQIDVELVDLLAGELGVDLDIRQPESVEDAMLTSLEQQDEDPALLEPRPPVVTFLGHVDHGKTSLLDKIIGIDVVKGEAGGITQHIRAYKVEKDDRVVSFVDTPGHEAFTEMRARGANVTDIAVLVIAADDGVMPQTEEAISHAKAAEVPIVVALNKIDLPGVDPNKTMQQLTAYELTPSEWGGDVEVVKTSAETGEGIDDLLETLLGIAELHEYKANPHRAAMGVCLEAEQEGGRGVIAKLIVKNGTMRVGDVVVCGAAYGRIKAMYDTLRPNKKVKEASPSTPVNITGLNVAPEAGDKFYILDDISKAREVAEHREDLSRAESLLGSSTKISFEDFQQRLEEGRLGQASEVATLNLIIRADVRGSIEAIQKELEKLEHPEVQIKILQASVGGITVADVTLAHASQAVLIGFNVIPDEAARSLAEDRQVEFRRYNIIYKVTDDLKATLEGKLKPEERIVELGRALVKQVFDISRLGSIAGCYVAQGSIQRGCRIRVNRDGRTIGDYPLDSLRRVKDDVKEVPRGMECGIRLHGFNDIKQDDVLEAYKIEEVARTL